MKNTRLLSLSLMVALSSGCGAKLNLEILAPAQITVPDDIQTIAFVDRSRAKNVGQGILGALEGAVTGEAIGADTQGRKTAAAGLIALLEDSPRFDVVEPAISRKELKSTLFDKPMDKELLDKICGPVACEAVVALEAFDSDSSTDFRTQAATKTVEGKQVATTEWTAVRTTQVLTAWRFYDVASGSIMDNLRDYKYARTWQATGKSRGNARNNLPGQVKTVKIVGEDAGANYGRRIAPHYVWVTRPWFGGGSDEMKLAKKQVKMDNWDAAAEIWRSVSVNGEDSTIQGKAHFNLALAAEVAGDIEGALAELTNAADKFANAKVRTYMRVLKQRLDDQQQLWDQMKGASGASAVEESVPEEAPLAVPGDTPDTEDAAPPTTGEE